MKESAATQIDFADVRIELGEIGQGEGTDMLRLENQRSSLPRPPANVRLSSHKQDKEVLLTSSDIFKMVKIDEPVRKSKPVKLPTIKMKKQQKQELSPLRDSQTHNSVAQTQRNAAQLTAGGNPGLNEDLA